MATDKQPTTGWQSPALSHGLEGRTALVVGATGGIGKAVALSLAEAGVRLVLHGRNEARLSALASQLGPLVTGTILQDLAEMVAGAGKPERLLAAAAAADILVVAWGPFVYRSLEDTTPDDWNLTALANLALPGMLATEAARGMAGRGFGRILLFGGTRTDSIHAYRKNAAYAAAKTGLGVLIKSVAAEYGTNGVTCTMICPGFVDTEYLDDTMRSRLMTMAPGGKLISADRIARLASNIISGDAGLTNGAIINADEGLVIH